MECGDHICLLYFAASTHDQDVFSFHQDEKFCNGFEEVLTRYREIVPQLRLAGVASIIPLVCLCYCINHVLSPSFNAHFYISMAGPTSFAPIIDMAITIVEQSGGQYHVLLIIADGQVSQHQVGPFSFRAS